MTRNPAQSRSSVESFRFFSRRGTALPAFWFVVLLAAGIPSGVRAEDISWRYDYNEARKEAQAKGQPLLLDFATEGCFWCRKLEDTTFREPDISSTVNGRFIALKLDAERNAFLVEALHVRSYPTLLLAAPDGKIIARVEGFVEPATFQDHLQRALASLESSPPAAKAEAKAPERSHRARELLLQARESYRAQQYLACLDQCEVLASGYGDLPEGKEAVQLMSEVRDNPDWMRQACDSLSERLSLYYLCLAESWVKKGQPQQAAYCLERVLQAFPGSRQADVAQLRLAQLQGQPSERANFKKP